MPEGKVYVIDDDEAMRDSLQFLLDAAEFDVTLFDSAQAFLDAVASLSFGCVVSDVRMPGIDGIELAEKLSAYPIPPPIVFLSAHGDVPASVKAMKDGAVDFLEKPVQEEDLFDALERAVTRSREESLRRRGLVDLTQNFAKLTPRERQVFALVISGLINKEVAWELGISEKTIKVHRARVVEKMGARSLPDLVRMAGRLGIPSDRPREDAPARTG